MPVLINSLASDLVSSILFIYKICPGQSLGRRAESIRFPNHEDIQNQ